MEKRKISHALSEERPQPEWLAVEDLATVERTSEDASNRAAA